MLNLYKIETKASQIPESLTGNEKMSVLYHSLFDYPLSFSDLIKWNSGVAHEGSEINIIKSKNYYFLEGSEGIIFKRTLRKRISERKLEIAKKAAKILSWIPSVKLIAVTGSLAMQNSSEESDIDLMIVTKKNLLWTTRLLAYLSFAICHLSFRRPFDKNQKDKLCLNVWLDESDLNWRDRNLYTAHEIAQIVPLANKDQTYEKFLARNSWILNYWPNSLKIKNLKIKNSRVKVGLIEKFAYKIQVNYMKHKITREVVTPTRALFHPQDWGSVVLDRVKSFS